MRVPADLHHRTTSGGRVQLQAGELDWLLRKPVTPQPLHQLR